MFHREKHTGGDYHENITINMDFLARCAGAHLESQYSGG
jgi:hypothetical protein